jgi:hypothetical protein
MTRKNVTTWVDCSAITKLQGELANEIVRYAPYCRNENAAGKFDGDSGLIVAAILLRNRLNSLIECSNAAQEKK